MKNIIAWLSLAALPFAFGCSDEGETEECVGLQCPAGFQWPDGGEVRIWSIRLPNGDVIQRFFAFFVDGAEPDVPLPLPSLGVCAPDVNGAQAANPEYVDVGESLTFKLADGQEVVVPRLLPNPDNEDCSMPTVPCAAGVPDWYHRMHQVAYLAETFAPAEAAPGPENYYNSFHDAEAADTIAHNPEGKEVDNIFLGPSFTVNKPARSDLGLVTLKKGEDVPFTWEMEQAPNPDVVHAIAILFVPDAPVPPTACITLNDGAYTVPHQAIDELAADTGIMLVGNGADQAIVTDDGRILHKWGLFCNLFPWQRVE